jgi:hypothetical protein
MAVMLAAPRAVAVALAVFAVAPRQTQAPPPKPQPFPGSAVPTAPAKPGPTGATSPGQPSGGAETQARPGPGDLPAYPGAEFLDFFDAGRSQRYYLYGTNASYADIVTYYKSSLKQGGRELFRTPPMHQFDLGDFERDSMAFPPSVVVKDYTWNGGTGYLALVGGEERRFRTVIQIVAR